MQMLEEPLKRLWRSLCSSSGGPRLHETFSADERRKRAVFIPSALLFSPILVAFGFYHLCLGNLLVGTLDLGLGGILLGCVALLRCGKPGRPIYTASISSLILFFLAQILVPDPSNSRSVWVFAGPVFAFFLLGRTIGLMVAGGTIFSLFIIVVGVPAFFGVMPIPEEFGVRLILSLTVVSGLVYIYERAREFYQAENEADKARLAEAKIAAEAASIAKSRFLATMSHELRTPMHGVLGMTELLLRSALEVEQREYAETVRSSAQDLLTLVDDILDFSKVEAGSMTLEQIPFDLDALVTDVARLLSPRASDNGVEFVARVSRAVPSRVLGDPIRVRQILVNLLGNAVKFTREGYVAVAVAPGDQLGHIRFMVEDSGIGIGEAERERLFQPFTQADTSTTRRFGGTGLGLALSRRLCCLMGGQIGVDSEAGRGSRFWFELPLRAGGGQPPELPALQGRVGYCGPAGVPRTLRVDCLTALGLTVELVHLKDVGAPGERVDAVMVDWPANRVEPPPLNPWLERGFGGRLILVAPVGRPVPLPDGISRLRKPASDQEVRALLACALRGRAGAALSPPPTSAQIPAGQWRGRVLVAEDHAVNQQLIRRLLTCAGLEVLMVADGQAAVEAALGEPFDLILMDCQMPVMDGIEATEQLRARLGDECPPVVALTANVLREDRERCQQAGMSGFLSKPFSIVELEAVLDRFVKTPRLKP